MEIDRERLKEEIRKELLVELRPSQRKLIQSEMIKVERKFHPQLIRINNGSTWEVIRRMTAYYLGYKRYAQIPDEDVPRAVEVAEKLCNDVIHAFGGAENGEA